METILEELSAGMPDSRQIIRMLIRLLTAAILGAMVGIQRERTGKPAGMRTHILVALGAALFTLAPQQAGMDSADVSRIIQGLATGIGFLGGGAILKLSKEREIKGLTTAAGIWMTAAVGVAAGLGRLGLALLGAILEWFILAILIKVEHEIDGRHEERNTL